MRNGMGSWPFVVGFLVYMVLWAAVNSWVLASRAWDPYPSILLNLFSVHAGGPARAGEHNEPKGRRPVTGLIASSLTAARRASAQGAHQRGGWGMSTKTAVQVHRIHDAARDDDGIRVMVEQQEKDSLEGTDQ